MITIAFQTEILDVRGTCVALYDYAKYFELLLHGRSIILTSKNSHHDLVAIDKFSKMFEIRWYDTNDDIQKAVHDCDYIYIIKYGRNDRYIPLGVKVLIHCVFDMSEPHGDVYAGVSKTLAAKFNSQVYVPHMISLRPNILSGDMRNKFKIPKTAFVAGRYGGQDTFNLQFTHSAILNAVNYRKDLWILLANTPCYIRHERVIYMNSFSCENIKREFINTCDAHLECGSLGHSFGLSIGEFSSFNKPIILYKGPVWNTAHYEILGNKGLYFSNEDELYNILLTFDREYYSSIDNRCYQEFTPEKVMKKFKEVFLNINNETYE